MLGAIYDGGDWSAGGIAGTLNGETLGGHYSVGILIEIAEGRH